MKLHAQSVLVMLVICGCSTSPEPAVLTTTNSVAVVLPVGAIAVNDPDHDIAFEAEIVPGRVMRITIDPFPASRTDLFADIAEYNRITEERVAVTSERFTNAQAFDVSLRQFRGANGDFNHLTAVARRSDTAVLLVLPAPGVVLSDSEAAQLKRTFRGVCESLN